MKLRQIALKLAALADADRLWLLQQLDHESRQALEPLIAEVIAMGMHRDPSVLDALADIEPVRSGQAENRQLLAETVSVLPDYWSRIVSSGTETTIAVETSQFLSLLEHDRSGPQALRRALVEIGQRKKQDARHV